MTLSGWNDMALKVCMRPGCPELIESGGYCYKHKRETTRNYNQYARDPEIQKLYNSGRWKHERRVFLNTHPLCECEECKLNDRTTAATMVDHKIPHNGDVKLFWDKSNWQAMSLEHHNIKTKADEKKCRNDIGNLHGKNTIW
jgi:5-methylcytosine-specific restriction protein A